MLTDDHFLAVRQGQDDHSCICLQIGGVSVSFGMRGMDVRLDPDHQGFAAPAADCDVEVEIEWADDLPPAQGEKVFDSGAIWTLYDAGHELIFDFTAPVLSLRPYRRLTINKQFSRGKLFLRRDCYADDSAVYALEYPLDELIVTNWLAQGRGVEVHGCGITDDASNSFLFIGHSGAGKSTTTRLWQSLNNVRILSDDRIILRKQTGKFWMYGTPWHGEAGFALPEKAAVHEIFILEHGGKNEIVPLAQSAAAAEIFARCFLPFHDARALTATLDYLDDLTSRVPCYKFQFLPDLSAVEKILEFHHSR